MKGDPDDFQAGQLRHRVLIQSQVDTDNGAGELVPTWTTIQELRAEVLVTGGSKMEISGGTQYIASGTVRHRFFRHLSPAMRYVWDGLVLQIAAIMPGPRRIGHLATWTQRETYVPGAP
jgi:head-tail adaptor